MNRILFFMTCLMACFIMACQNTPPTTEEAATTEKIETTPSEKPETIQENNDLTKITSIEDDVQFIRDKYAVISEATHYRTVPFETQCDERSSVKLERKYNEKNELCYLQYHLCSEHGCFTKHHYYWDGELIFIFSVDSFMPGNSHIIKEHRTYFKNGQMIRCLEKNVQSDPGQAPAEELLKTAMNVKVNCNPHKLTDKLSELESLSIDKAKSYFCDY